MPDSGMPEKLITRDGYERLTAEIDYLFRVLRPQTVQRIAAAAAEGDRSENAEYIYGRKKLREIDNRLSYLRKLTDGVRIIDPEHIANDVVRVGSTVRLLYNSTDERTWMIVGEGEALTECGQISCKSPIARAVLHRRVGDVVVAELPGREEDIELEILEIQSRRAPPRPAPPRDFSRWAGADSSEKSTT